MKLFVLTSSRADFGIYLPLLSALESAHANVTVIAFGSHFSDNQAQSINEVREQWNGPLIECNSFLPGDRPADIAKNVSNNLQQLSEVYADHTHPGDTVLCLGDRHEMMAAVVASIPFQLRVAHLYGGEITLGSLDNIHRNIITDVATIHFVSNPKSIDLIRARKGEETVEVVGSISLAELDDFEPMTKEEIALNLGLNTSKHWILFTFHPEHATNEETREHADQVATALRNMNDFEVIVSAPNDDAHNRHLNHALNELNTQLDHIHVHQHLGKKRYFSLMQHSALVAGNSSSGIIEAASFGKHVVNIGRRQEGRFRSDNVIEVPIAAEAIAAAIHEAAGRGTYAGTNIYAPLPDSLQRIIQTLSDP